MLLEALHRNGWPFTRHWVIVITSLLHHSRIWPTLWRRKLAWWLVDARDNLPFLAMVALPIMGMAGIVCFA